MADVTATVSKWFSGAQFVVDQLCFQDVLPSALLRLLGHILSDHDSSDAWQRRLLLHFLRGRHLLLCFPLGLQPHVCLLLHTWQNNDNYHPLYFQPMVQGLYDPAHGLNTGAYHNLSHRNAKRAGWTVQEYDVRLNIGL